MWLAGAVGLACGLGLWLIALFGTGLVRVVLVLLHALQRKVVVLAKSEDAAERKADNASP